jgi:hypothetical protein
LKNARSVLMIDPARKKLETTPRKTRKTVLIGLLNSLFIETPLILTVTEKYFGLFRGAAIARKPLYVSALR